MSKKPKDTKPCVIVALPVPAPKEPDFGDKLGKAADHIADLILDSSTEAMHPDEKVSAFKALTTYYAMVSKLPSPEGEDKGAFSGFKKSLANLGRDGQSGDEPGPDFDDDENRGG